MDWVIQENVNAEGNFNSLLENIARFGQTYDLVKVVPFVGDIIPDVDHDDKVICFGAYSMRTLAQRKGWSPGVYDIEWFPYSSLVECLGRDVLNYDAVFGKFGDIMPATDDFFIRPIHDGKEFAGTVMSMAELLEWRVKVNALGGEGNGSTIDCGTAVMCAGLKKIYNEYRYFVVDGRVVTGSQYKLGRRVVYGDTDGGIDVAQKFVDKLNSVITHPYVIDLALTEDGHKVIELNTLNCAGFYACDMQKLVGALVDYEHTERATE